MLNGQLALVTGGGRGIGRATALALASRGAAVAVNYLSDHRAALEVVTLIESGGGRAFAVQADVRREADVQRMMERLCTEEVPLSIVVNNANIPFVLKPLPDLTWSEFSQKVTWELEAAFLLTQGACAIMKPRHYGRLVYIGAGLAHHAAPGWSAHGVAKAALEQFAKYVATEYGPWGITANVVIPGLVQTDASAFQPQEYRQRVIEQTPLGRIARTEDIAGAVLMLVGEDSAFISGASIPVNGGII